MPIYAYKCGSCGHAKDVLQKISDAPLTDCPVCGAPAFTKQVTAAGFQLKGSGWYATDFRGGSKGPGTNGAGKSDDAKSEGAAKPDTAAPSDTAKSGGDGGKPGETSSGAKSNTPAASAGACGGACACH